MPQDIEMTGSATRRGVLLGGLGAAFVLTGRDAALAQTSDRYVDLAARMQGVAVAGTESSQPQRILAELDQALAKTVGHKLFTVLVLNHEKGENQRYYTNQPEAYPVGGSKPIVRNNEFFKEVVEAGRPRICYNYEDMKRAFFDHELIRSLGCESAVNYPIRWNGRTIGALNLLHQAGWYSDRDMPALSGFAGLVTPALMDIVRAWG